MKTLPCVELKNGMFLTLRERRIMLDILDEAFDRAQVFNDLNAQNEMRKVYSLLGDYIAAYERGNINRSDFERCG